MAALNQRIAALLAEIADLLEIRGEDGFRVNSYRRAARAVEGLTSDIGEVAQAGGLLNVPGIGKTMAARIDEYLRTGHIAVRDEMTAELPASILELLSIPGLGPKKAQVLWKELQIGCMAELKAAIAAGRLDSLKGFGSKTVHKISEGISFLESCAGCTPLGVALPIAEALRLEVLALPGVSRAEVAGSLRRGKEVVGDVDLLCMADDGAAVIAAFTALPAVEQVLGAGDTKASVLVDNPLGGQLQADLRVVPAASFGAAWQYFTGSKEHNVKLRELAGRRGWKLNEYGLLEGERAIAGEDEAGVYQALGLPHIAPELREDRGEIEAAAGLPALLNLSHILGDLHLHTTASDGRASIEEMAEAAMAKGYRYIAITDHSRSSAIAGGLTAERLAEHITDVRQVQQRLGSALTLLAGTECDILPDGSLDYPDELLAQLDWVVASVHSAMGAECDKVTARMISAIRNRFVSAIGHASGRLLGRREAVACNWDQVFAAAAETGTAMEINASWQRLDLKDLHARQAIAAGCKLVISTDAHSTDQMGMITFGVSTARRGWACPGDVINTWPIEELRSFIAAKRGR